MAASVFSPASLYSPILYSPSQIRSRMADNKKRALIYIQSVFMVMQSAKKFQLFFHFQNQMAFRVEKTMSKNVSKA